MSRLRDLEALLRDEAKWPEGFTWDYLNTTCCALGLAAKANIVPDRDILHLIGPRDFQMSATAFSAIFHTRADGLNTYRFDDRTIDLWRAVTPTVVADRIAAHLEHRRR